MNTSDLDVYRCPACRGRLVVDSEPAQPELESGLLRCQKCSAAYPVVRHVPRFAPSSSYADSFGLQWNTFRKTQLDSYSGTTLSRDRFFECTGFPTQMTGELVLEAGSGAGRFTEIAKTTGARLFTFDYTSAVDANRESNGDARHVSFAQANILEPPFADDTFDRVFCMGVIQHLPDPEAGFRSLVRLVKPGGEIAIDVYRKVSYDVLHTGALLRRITRRMSPARLLRIVKSAWPRLVPIKRAIQRIPVVGDKLDGLLIPICDYGQLALDEKLRTEWGILDTFDYYSARYEYRQRIADVQRWFDRAAVEPIRIGPGPNGIVARGRKRSQAA